MLEAENLVRTEASHMTDEEILHQYREKSWSEDSETKAVLADDIVERLELRDD